MKAIRFALLLVAILFGVPGASAAVASLSIDSDPGDPVGQGNVFLLEYDSNNGSNIFPSVRKTISAAPSEISLVLQLPVNGGSLDFANFIVSSHETGAPLTIGTYDNAVRSTAQGMGLPLFDFSFQGRGNNTHTAAFTISEIAFSGTGPSIQLDRFAATFQQQGTSASGGLTGSILFNVSAVPEPSPWIPAGIAVAVMAAVAQRRRLRLKRS